MSAKRLSEIIDDLAPESQGGRYLGEPVSVVVSLRIPLEYRILLDVIAKKAGKTRSTFAGEVLMAGLQEIRESDAFGEESSAEFKQVCMDSGVFLDEFMTQEEQLELWKQEEREARERFIAEQKKESQEKEEGQNVQA